MLIADISTGSLSIPRQPTTALSLIRIFLMFLFD